MKPLRPRKFGIIGLGRFGYQIATGLAEHGMEVLAIDSSESIVSSIRDQVTQAVCMRVGDEVSLRNIGIDEMDVVIVAMGENFAQSVLATALLKKHLNVPIVITRAINDIHEEVLKLVGADRVVLPEKEIGIKIADSLASPVSYLARLARNYAISQVKPLDEFIGKTIQEINFLENYKVSCVAIRRDEQILLPTNDLTISSEDRIILAGSNDALEEFID